MMKRGVFRMGAVLVVAGAVYLLFVDRPSDVGGFGPDEEMADREAVLLEGDAPEGVSLNVLGTESVPTPVAEPDPLLAERTATLTVDVVGPDGAHVESANVMIDVLRGNRTELIRHTWLPSRRDIPVPPKPLRVMAFRRDMRRSGTVEVDLSGGRAQVSLRLTTPQHVSGTVHAPSGIRLNNAMVLALPLEGRHVTDWTHIDDFPDALRTNVKRLEPTYTLGLGEGRYLMAFSYGEDVHLQGVVVMEDTGIEKDIHAPSPRDVTRMTVRGLTRRLASRMVVRVTRVRDGKEQTVPAIVVPTDDDAYLIRPKGHRPNDVRLAAHVRVPRGEGTTSFELGRAFDVALTLEPELEPVTVEVQVQAESGEIVRAKMQLTVSLVGKTKGRLVDIRDGRATFSATPGVYRFALNNRKAYVHQRRDIEITEATRRAGPVVFRVSTYTVEVSGAKPDQSVYLTTLTPRRASDQSNLRIAATASATGVAMFRNVLAGRYNAGQDGRGVFLIVPDQRSVRMKVYK